MTKRLTSKSRRRLRDGCGLLPWVVAALSALGLNAAEIPLSPLPASLGVNIHFTRGHERELDMIAAAGFKFVRMDFEWAAIECQKGRYDWSAYDELTANLEKRGIRPYYILDYSNPLYETTPMSPQHPESVRAFARWAAAAARHFQDRGIVWEIWNEPNGGGFWKPGPDVAQYIILALATCKAIREADPQATIVAPATSTFPWDFLESFLKSGVLKYLDGVSVHPYRSATKPPETAAEDYQRLRKLIERHAPDEAKKRIPILSGEWGYPSCTNGVSLETQAAFIARQQLANLLDGIPLSIWYDWKNDGTNPAEPEHNFGVVTPDLKPKPAYVAIQTLTHELSGYRITRRYDTGNKNDFVLVLANSNGENKLAAWTIAKPHTVMLDFKVKTPTAVKGDGESCASKIENGQLAVELGPVPQYVSLR